MAGFYSSFSSFVDNPDDSLRSCFKYVYRDADGNLDREKMADREQGGENIGCLEDMRWPHADRPFSSSKFRSGDLDAYIEKFFANSDLWRSGRSPFQFQADYANLSTEQLCDYRSFSLKAQQMFLGKFISPMTDFPGVLIYHGLGSGKTLTSLVTGESNKNRTTPPLDRLNRIPPFVSGQVRPKVRIVCPAALQQQYINAILGAEIKDGKIAYNDRTAAANCFIRIYSVNEKGDEVFDTWPPKDNIELGIQGYTSEAKATLISDSMNAQYLRNKLIHLRQALQELAISGNDRSPKYVNYYKEWINTTAELVQLEQSVKTFEDGIKAGYKRVYDVMTHQSFANHLMSGEKLDPSAGTNIEFNSGEARSIAFQPSEQVNLDPFWHTKDSLLIIDEAQKLISVQRGALDAIRSRKLYYTLNYYARQNNDEEGAEGDPAVKVVLMTATPIVNNSYEGALLLNLLRPRIPFPTSYGSFNDMFIRPGDLNDPPTLKNPILFNYMCSGYVSYFKGGNPEAYPFNCTTVVLNRMSTYQDLLYTDVIIKEAGNDETDPKNKQPPSGNAFYDFIDKQDQQTTFLIKSQQVCGIAFPPAKPGEDRLGAFYRLLYQKRNQLKSQVGVSDDDVVSGILKFLEKYEESTQTGGYSAKFAYLIGQIYKATGPVFVYTNRIKYGIEPLVAVLNVLGWNRVDAASVYTARATGNHYAVWSGAGGEIVGYNEDKLKRVHKTKDPNLVKQIFNSDENIDGSLIKVIFGTSAIAEGVSFKHVKEAHLLEPRYNQATMDQIIGRSIRFCSHSDLPENDRFVKVYLHASTLRRKLVDEIYPGRHPEIAKALPYGEFSNLSIDQIMYMKSMYKQGTIRQFERAMKGAALDRILNQEGNIIRFERREYPTQETTVTELWNNTKVPSFIVYYNPSNGYFYKNASGNTVERVVLSRTRIQEGSDLPVWPPSGISDREGDPQQGPELGGPPSSLKVLSKKSSLLNLYYGSPPVEVVSIFAREDFTQKWDNEVKNLSFSQARELALSREYMEEPEAWAKAGTLYFHSKLTKLLYKTYLTARPENLVEGEAITITWNTGQPKSRAFFIKRVPDSENAEIALPQEGRTGSVKMIVPLSTIEPDSFVGQERLWRDLTQHNDTGDPSDSMTELYRVLQPKMESE